VSLLTQMVIANGEFVTRYVPATGLVIAGTDVALSVEFVVGGRDEASGGAAGAIRSDEVTLPNPRACTRGPRRFSLRKRRNINPTSVFCAAATARTRSPSSR